MVENKKLRIGVVGAGRWGGTHIRTCQRMGEMEIIALCDHDEGNLRAWPGIPFRSTSLPYFLENSLDGVIITTPIASHYEVAMKCLEAGKNVLIEKPLASTASEARVLQETALANRALLCVGFQYRFHRVVLEAQAYLESQRQNDPQGERWVTFIWHNTESTGEDLLLDLGAHPLSVLLLFFPDGEYKPLSFEERDEKNIGICEGLIGTTRIRIELSWLEAEKKRSIIIESSSGKKVFDLNVDPDPLPLDLEQEHFKDCVLEDQWSQIMGGDIGVAVAELTESIRSAGRPS